MLTGTIKRPVADFLLERGRSAEYVAEIDFIAHPGSRGDRWEPGEAPYGEATEVRLVRIWTGVDYYTGKPKTERTVVECPTIFRDDIIADAQDELDGEALELLGDDADRADEAYDMRRTA